MGDWIKPFSVYRALTHPWQAAGCRLALTEHFLSTICRSSDRIVEAAGKVAVPCSGQPGRGARGDWCASAFVAGRHGRRLNEGDHSAGDDASDDLYHLDGVSLEVRYLLGTDLGCVAIVDLLSVNLAG